MEKTLLEQLLKIALIEQGRNQKFFRAVELSSN